MSKGQIIAIVLAAAVAVLVYVAARSPKLPETEAVEAIEKVEEPKNLSLDAKVARAVEMIEGGTESPMEAIMLLREVIQEDPNHMEANYWLGEFSMMSGQFEKAVERFEKVLKMQPDNLAYCLKLADAYFALGRIDDAKNLLIAFKSNYPSEETREQIEIALNKMNVNS